MADAIDNADGPSLPPGLIDIHSHLLPAIDDGSQAMDESLECVRLLKQAGFVGTICTPHMWPDTFLNTPDQVRGLTANLQRVINENGLDYRVWPGGELRLWPDVISWMETNGVPTLADSRCVLLDMWEDRWPRWIEKIFAWLKDRHFQPILAHPERINVPKEIDRRIASLAEMGVWMQCNYQSMTGENGYWADRYVRQWLQEERCKFMALDMHGLRAIEGRLDGIRLTESEFGSETVQQLTSTAPRRHIFGLDDVD